MITEQRLWCQSVAGFCPAPPPRGHPGRVPADRDFSPFLSAGTFCNWPISASVCRTFREFFSTRPAASVCCSGEGKPRMTLAWPTESRPSRTKVCNSGASFKRRSALATTARLLPTLSGGLILGQLELADQLGVALRLFDGVEIFPLQILDQGQFQNGAVIGLAHDDRHLGQTEHLGRAPAPFPGDQFEIPPRVGGRLTAGRCPAP